MGSFRFSWISAEPTGTIATMPAASRPLEWAGEGETHMKNQIRFAITLAAAAFCALPNLAMAQGGPGDSQGGQEAAIEGTWIFKITVAPGVAFTALQSFTAGGVTVATGTSDRMQPFAPSPTAPISPLYGSWSGADDTYVVTLCLFTYNLNGVATGMFKTNETFRLTGYNTLIGVGVGLSCAQDGSGCKSAGQPPITITGTRLIAQGASN